MATNPGTAANVSSLSGWDPSTGAPIVHAHKTIVSGKAIEELFVVLAVMVVLGIVASMVGRMCGGRHLGNNSQFDFEGWVEKRCAVCIEGHVEEDVPPVADQSDQPTPPLVPAEGDQVVPPAAEGETGTMPLPPDGAVPSPELPPPDPPLPAAVAAPSPPPPPLPPPQGSTNMAMAPVVVPYHHYYYHYPTACMNNSCRCYYCYHPPLPYG